jgi:hypothetical protein
MVTGNERGGRTAMNRALPMLSVFADWALLHAHYSSSSTAVPIDVVDLTASEYPNPSAAAASHPSQRSALKRGNPRVQANKLPQQEEDIAPPSMFADTQRSATR